MFREASNIVAELKLLYNTQHVIASGDCNAVLEPEPVFVDLLRSPGIDSQPGGIDSLEPILGILNGLQILALIDLARKTNKLEHTWFKISSQSWRIDMILTSVPVTSLRMDKLHTIFDPHLSLCVTLSPARTIHNVDGRIGRMWIPHSTNEGLHHWIRQILRKKSACYF
jgi:hypothetical protein